jgi:hypothetical protein
VPASTDDPARVPPVAPGIGVPFSDQTYLYVSASLSASANPLGVAVSTVPAVGEAGVIATEPLVGGVSATVTTSLTPALEYPCELVAFTSTSTLPP